MKYFLEHLWKCSGIVVSGLFTAWLVSWLDQLGPELRKPKFLFNNLGVNNTQICKDSDFLCSQNDAVLPSFTADIN